MGLAVRELYAIAIVSAFLLFAIVFFVGWVLSAIYSKHHFRTFPLHEKADWASRINSQLHCIIVVPGFIFSLAFTNWDSEYYPKEDDRDPSLFAVRMMMCISMGYFAFDLLCMVWYRVPGWIIFTIHHIVASIPFHIQLFWQDCSPGAFALGAYLLVEVATFFLNIQVWMEKTGHAKELKFSVAFYATYVSWIFSRLALPTYVMYVFWRYIWLLDNDTKVPVRNCLIPAMVCGHLIWLFCFAVFIFVMTPDLLKRWRQTSGDIDEEEKEVEAVRQKSNLERRNSQIAMEEGAAVPGSTEPTATTTTTTTQGTEEAGSPALTLEQMVQVAKNDNPVSEMPADHTEEDWAVRPDGHRSGSMYGASSFK